MDYILMHHGILGQKWGVRRTPEQLGHYRSKKKNNKAGMLVNPARKLEREKHLTLQTDKSSDNFRQIKPKTNITKDDADDYWAKRFNENRTGSQTTSKGKRGGTQESDTHEDYKRARRKSTKQMSDKELREALNRLRMEDEYKRLNPNSVSRGRKIVKTALAATTAVSTAAATAITIKSQYKTIRSWFDHSGNG